MVIQKKGAQKMRTIKIIAKQFEKKAGGTFTKLSVGGKFLPLALAEDDVQYTVKFTANSEAKEPSQEGIYEVAYRDNKLWIDSRPECVDKNIVRIEAHKVVFSKPLPRLEKDVRLVK